MDTSPSASVSRGQRLLAWCVHGLTASGAALALLALDAVGRQAWREVLLWQLAALAIDGIDGTLARAVKVKERVPRIDGEALDLIVDYLNYVFVPSLLMWRSGALPEPVALPLLILVHLSSLYIFTRRDMKTDDGYFRGFPALWNVVAAYAVVLTVDSRAMAVIVLALVGLSFAPIHVVHPFRTIHLPRLARLLALIWAGSTLLLILDEPGAPSFQTALAASLGSLAGIIAFGLVKTMRSLERHSSAD